MGIKIIWSLHIAGFLSKDEEYLDKDCLEEWGENTPLRGGGSGYEIAVIDFLKDRELIDYIREYGIK